MTSPLLRPGPDAVPHREPLEPEAAPRRVRHGLARLYPASVVGTVAALGSLVLLALALQQWTLWWPGAAIIADAYRYVTLAVVLLWGVPGLVWHVLRGRGTQALELGLCLAGFVAVQALLPGLLTNLTMNLPPVTPAEAYLTATPTPRPTATPLASELIGVSRDDGVNVRAGPGLDYPVVRVLGKGNMLAVTGRDERGEWVYVVYPDRTTGWVAREFMNLTHNGQRSEPWGLPVMPTPTPVP